MENKTDYLNELNDKQREAVLATEGPVLIVAGAGSGKTRVLIYRMIHLVLGKGIHPSSILGVTFTNRAAEEMKSRIRNSLGSMAERIWISTFHSTCAQILRQEISKLGYSRNFVIYDEEDSLSVVKRIMKEKGWDEKVFSPKWVRGRIEWIKRDLLEFTVDEAKKLGPAGEMLTEVYQGYSGQLRLANALDFNDLLLLAVQLFELHPDVLARYQDRFRYIMVDEYQDTNYIQYLLVRHLAKKDSNICVVGDEDQSIYRWRGANIENILNFERDFPNAKVIKLEENYRSTKIIISSASKLISHNQKRIAKTLWTSNPEGEKIRVVECADERNEAERVVENMLRLASSGFKYKDFAVFYRVNAQSRPIEDTLRARQIPYQVFGGLKFYDRKEVKDILAYLRLLTNPDDNVALLRVINTPTRGIGNTTQEQVARMAQARGMPMFKALPVAAASPEYPERARNALKEFLRIMAELERGWKSGMPLSDLVALVMDESRYEESLVKESTAESETRLENIEELINAVDDYSTNHDNPTLEDFLEKTALFSDIDQFSEEGLVSLMTLHTAKGLEFPVVTIVGVEEGLSPHVRSIEEGDDDELEEERRLLYVGMTRAKQRLCLYYARARRLRGTELFCEPSRFLDELPQENLQVEHAHAPQLHKRKPGLKWKQDDVSDFDADYSGQEVWDSELEVSWRPGMAVRHPVFGKGLIERVEGSEDKIKLVVKFDRLGTKKLVAHVAKLEVIK